MQDVWGVKKGQDKQGIQQLKRDIGTVYKYGKEKYTKYKGTTTVKIPNKDMQKVLKYMDKNGIEYEL